MKTFYLECKCIVAANTIVIRGDDNLIPNDSYLVRLRVLATCPVWARMEIVVDYVKQYTVLLDIRAGQPHSFILNDAIFLEANQQIDFHFTCHEPVTGDISIDMDVELVNLTWWQQIKWTLSKLFKRK